MMITHLLLGSASILSQPLKQAMNPFCDFSNHSFTWVWIDPETDKPYVSWSLHFPQPEEEANFNRIFYASMYESVNRESLSKASNDTQVSLGGFSYIYIELFESSLS
jgi:hypothetical protein